MTGLAVTRVGDVPVGSLVAVPVSHAYGYAIVVRAPARPAPGVLFLAPMREGKAPAFGWSNDYCLHLNVKPILRWSGAPEALSNSFSAIPPAGHLVVCGKSLLISGVFPGMIGSDPVYWDLATGESATVDHSTVVYIRDWNLGLLDSEGKFKQLAEFPAKPQK